MIEAAAAAATGLSTIRGNLEQAQAQASEALSLCQELDDARGIAWFLEVFAALLAARGCPEVAARPWVLRTSCSNASAVRRGTPLDRERHIKSVRPPSATPDSTARAEGRAMSLAQAVALARQPAVHLS